MFKSIELNWWNQKTVEIIFIIDNKIFVLFIGCQFVSLN